MIRIKCLGLMIICVLGIVLNGCTVKEEYIAQEYITEEYITEEYVTLNVTEEYYNEYVTINEVTQIVQESPYNAVVVDVGAWDMNKETGFGYSFKYFQTGIPNDEIIMCLVSIIADNRINKYMVVNSNRLGMTIKTIGSGIYIERDYNSFFNSPDFSDTGYNRGYVVVLTSKPISPLAIKNIPNARIFNK